MTITSSPTGVAPELVRRLLDVELGTFADRHPRTRALHQQARESLLDGVPMNWMVKWAGPFPLFLESAAGAHVTCADGHDYVDLCLGDTGAMAGHGPAQIVWVSSMIRIVPVRRVRSRTASR